MKRFSPLALTLTCAAVLTSTAAPSWAAGAKVNSQAAALEEQVVAREKSPASKTAAPAIPDGPTSPDGPNADLPIAAPPAGKSAGLPKVLDPSHVVFAADSFFAFDRSDLRVDNVRTLKKIVTEEERQAVDVARRKLDLLADRLKDIRIESVGIYGHTDSDGPESYNQKLSQRRAESIRQYLISRGVPAEKIKSYGEGELKPIADNATREGRAKNRRVEIEINGAMATKK
ncbi:MAG: OmpA family protein [Leptothrix ochracea]|uniref:OmpA family protein n=1 Tax=Leptothrix ochracea TaxID=735331 RepID=UPI0034E246BD